MQYAIVNGRLTLSSGETARVYVDLRQVTLHGPSAIAIGRTMLKMLSDLEFEAVGGLTLGADPVATAMMHQAYAQLVELDAFVVRNQPKSHGTGLLIEGPSITGRPVVVVEDTSTTGRSALRAAEAVRDAGAKIVCVAAVVDRGARQAVEAAGFEYRSAFLLKDVWAELSSFRPV